MQMRRSIIALALVCLALLFVQGLASASPTCSSAIPVTSSVPSTASTTRIFALGVTNATGVTFQTWWIGGVQPAPVSGVNASGGIWYADVQLNQYDVGNPRYGSFETDVYMSDSTGVNVLCKATTWTRAAPTSLPASVTPAYYYDANSRLVDYLPAATMSANFYDYGYDFLGNLDYLTAIPATSFGAQIREFYPIQGSPGTPVIIHGGVYGSPTTVKFNGLSATVTSSSLSDVIAVVPSGATTGPISVTSVYGTGTSASPFVVLPGTSDPFGAQPKISGFSNSGGGVNSPVTVTGSNFIPFPGQTVVRVGGTQVIPTSISDTQIQFNIPAGQGTDYIYVTTPYGTAHSGSQLTIVFPKTLSSQVTLQTGVQQTLTLASSSSCGAFTFAGSSSNWRSLQLASVPSGVTVNYMLYGPDNQPVAPLDNSQYNTQGVSVCAGSSQIYRAFQGTLSSSNLSIHFPPLPASGTYTLLVSSSSGASLPATLVADPSVLAGGQSTVSILTSGQSHRIQIVGTQAQSYVLDVLNQSVSPSGSSLTITGLSPFATPVGTARSLLVGQSASFISGADAAPYGGVLVSANSGVTGTIQLAFDTGIPAALTLDAAPLTINQTAAGRATRVSTTFTPSQAVTLAITNISPSTVTSLTLTILDPYGNTWSKWTCQYVISNGNCSWDFDDSFNPTPKIAGNYIIAIAPSGTTTYTANLSLASDLRATLPEQQLTTVSLMDLPGRTERLTYTSTAQVPEPVLITVNNIQTTPFFQHMFGKLTFPAGSATALKEAGAADFSSAMLFWCSALDANKQIALQLGASNVSSWAQGVGSGSEGFAKVYLDTSITKVAISGFGNPISRSFSTIYPGQGQQLEISPYAGGSINLSTTANTDVEGFIFYALNSAGTQWNATYIEDLGDISPSSCQSSGCTQVIPANPFGFYPQMLILAPWVLGTQIGINDWVTPPDSAATTFNATVTLSQ